MNRPLPVLELHPLSHAVPSALLLLATFASAQDSLAEIPDSKQLQKASKEYLAVFEIKDGLLTGKDLRNQTSGPLGLAAWKRLTALFPAAHRNELVQFNVQAGERWAGMFDGDGRNDVNQKGYRLSIADYTLRGESQLEQAKRPVTPRRGTLDWTVIHEMGHYICLKQDLIEKFSQAFDVDKVPQPTRRKDPQDYPEDGSPKLDGNFVTSYAERNPGDEEAVETFTTYLTVAQLPGNASPVAQKILFFDRISDLRDLRRHIQSLSKAKH